MKRSSLSDRYCSIARSSAELTDAWTFMILREVFLNNHRFDGILAQTGMSPRSLTLRLKHLVETGVLEKKPYQAAPVRHEYRLTRKGVELWPVVIALKQWGDKWHGPWSDDEPPVNLLHKSKGHPLRLKHVCETCGEDVTAHDSEAMCSKALEQEREALFAGKN